MNNKDAIWLLGIGFGLIALWLDYKTLNFASQAILNIKQDTERLLKAMVLSVLLNTLIFSLMETQYTFKRLGDLNLPFWLHVIVVPAIIYGYVLRNQSGQRLNAIQLLGLCSIKQILLIQTLLLLCIPTFFLYMMFDYSS